MERWSLDYENLSKIRPDIIFVSMPSMGRNGPYSNYRGLSWNLMAVAGWNSMTGYPDTIPIAPSPHSHPDTSCNPFHAATAVLAALCYRAKTGKGQNIEVSQFESTLCFTETGIFDYLINSRARERRGNRLDYAAPHGIYPCKGEDQWCAIAVFTEKEWKALCQVIGREELSLDVKFNTLARRLKYADELDSIIEKWTKERTPWQVMELMQEAGVAAGVVENVADLLQDPQLKARGHWVVVEHPEAGKMTLEEWGFKLSSLRERSYQPAPLLGQHTDFVLGELLGLTEEEINQLILEGVIG